AVRLAAAESGRWACDTVYGAVSDPEGYTREAEAARRLGYVGKSCIHPTQVPLANAVFRPSDQEIAAALRVVEAARGAERRGVGAFLVDGHMIDGPFIHRAEAVVGAARRLGLLSATERERRGSSAMTGSSVSASSAAEDEMIKPTHRLTLVVLGLYAFSILSIGLSRDWRLLHEDNGAMHTTLALSHLELGLATTRAHDVFFNPRTGETLSYGHHPPGIALILAGAFLATGSDAPWVARLVVIGFHLASIFLLVELLTRVLPRATALLGGFLMATLPMSAYFGRMVNYEPACLFAILLQLTGYATFKQDGARKGLVRLSLGIVFGGLIDWGAIFFAAA